MPLFVSNTLMRAVKLSNSLPVPSDTNNGTFYLAVVSDINKHSHKENRQVTCAQTNTTTTTLTDTALNTQRDKERATQ